MNLFGFRGTISHTQFWLVTLAGPLAACLVALPLYWLPQGVLLDAFFLGYLAFLCGFCWVFFALHAKRLRDAGHSPWLCILLFVPLVHLVITFMAGFKPTQRMVPDIASGGNDSPVWRFLHPEGSDESNMSRED